jgi:hypothetical protein
MDDVGTLHRLLRLKAEALRLDREDRTVPMRRISAITGSRTRRRVIDFNLVV